MDSSLSHRGGLNAFYWYQIFALDFAKYIVMLHKSIVLAFHHYDKTSYSRN